MLSFYHLTASNFNYPMCSSCERELNAKKKILGKYCAFSKACHPGTFSHTNHITEI